MEHRAIDGGFVQLYRDYMPMIRKLNMMNPMAANVFLYLAEKMDRNNAVACSMRALEEAFKVSRQTISKAIKDLKSLNFIHVYKMGTSNVYTMNANVVWNSHTDGRAFAVFDASIIITASEQDKETARQIKEHRVKVVECQQDQLPPDDAFPPDTSAVAAKDHAKRHYTTKKPAPNLPTDAPVEDFTQEDLPL